MGAPRLAVFGLLAVIALTSLFLIFRLGNQASAGVTLNDPVVWIEHGSQGEVLQVNGSTQEITARVRVGERGDSIVAIPRGRDAVFLNRTTGELGVIGAVSLEVDKVDTLDSGGGLMTGDQLALHGRLDVSTDAFVVDTGRTLVIEPGAGIRLPIPTPEGLGDVAVDPGGRLLAITVDGMQVAVSDDRGLVPFAELAAPIANSEQSPQLVSTGDSVYVVDPDRRTVNPLDTDGALGTTTCVAGSLSNVRVGSSHTSDSSSIDRVLVHDPVNRVLSVSEPQRSDCYEIAIDIDGEEYGEPLSIGRFAYLPNWELGQIVVVDLDERTVVESHRFSTRRGRPFELEVFDNAVWANEPQGPVAGLLRGRDLQRISKLTRVVIETGGDEDGGDAAVVGDADGDQRFFGNDGDFVGGGGSSSESDQSVGGGDEVSGGTESANNSDLDEGSAEEQLEDAPVAVVVDGVTQAEQTEELQANFEFTADTVNVGEEVGFTDVSTGDPVSWNWSFGDGTGAEGPEVVKAWSEEGVWTVELFVTDAAGSEASQSVDITVVAVDQITPPTANFRFRSDTVEVGETLEFEDASSGDPETLVWDFGDGTTANGPLVDHRWSEPGLFTVELTAANGAGSDTTSATITVVEAVQPPEAIIGSFPRLVETGQSVTLVSESTNTPTAVSWDFGDGTTALGSEVRHAWDDPGTYRIRLFVSNSAGESTTFADIVIQPRVDPPIARFTESGLEVVAGETLSFSDLSLNNPTRFTWEFGDGATASGPNVTHRFTEPGTTTVTLTVENEAGTDDVSKTVTVLPPPPDPPTASFSVANAIVPVNVPVLFTDTSTGDPTNWSWNFGDGTSSSAQSPAKSFLVPGTYEVTLTASNAGGDDSTSQTIVVIDPPVAAFDLAASELVVTFTDTSTNEPTGWAWNFGDGSSSTGQNPTHTYDAPGSYTISLIASNVGGSSAPFERTVTVAEIPLASFSASNAGLTVSFTDTSTRNPTNWSWNFGDGSGTSATQSPAYTYSAPGEYTVQLTVSNAAGSTTTSTVIDVKAAPPVADFTCTVVGAAAACDGTSSSGAASYSWSAPSGSPSSSSNSMPTFTFPSAGTFNITLTVENAFGDPDSVTKSVTVSIPPEVTITDADYDGAGVITASASATNGPVTWDWDINNGGSVTSGESSSSATFSVPSNGTYTISVTATNGAGSDSTSTNITVTDLNAPTVNVNASYGGAGAASATASVSSTLPILSSSWSIDGGGTVVSENGTSSATFSVPSNGSYNITLSVTNAQGTSNDSDTIVVGDLNPPAVTITSLTNAAGTISASASATEGPVTWQWRLNGVLQPSQTTANATFTVTSNGVYNVEATATNAFGSGSDAQSTTVSDGPTADFSWTDAGSLTVNFTNTSSIPTTATAFWQFGDPPTNGTSTLLSPSYTYGTDGTYSVTLTMTNGSLVSSITKSVTVAPPPATTTTTTTPPPP